MLELLNQLDGFDSRGDVKVSIVTSVANCNQNMFSLFCRIGAKDCTFEFISTCLILIMYVYCQYVPIGGYASISTFIYISRVGMRLWIKCQILIELLLNRYQIHTINI